MGGKEKQKEKLMLYEQELYDFNIEDIVNVVTFEADREWKLNNLVYPDQWIIGYVMAGELFYHMVDQTVRVEKGSMLFFPKQFCRSANSNPFIKAKTIAIKFKLEEKSEKASKLLRSIPNYFPQTMPSMVKLIYDITDTWSKKRPGYTIRCKGLLYLLMYQLLNQSDHMVERNQYERQLSGILEMIENNIVRCFTVTELADAAKLSPSYFRNIFKQYTGYSPIQYQHFLKMMHARDLLLSEHYNVSEVAAMVGISDESYFSRLFKKVMGVTPSQAARHGYGDGNV